MEVFNISKPLNNVVFNESAYNEYVKESNVRSIVIKIKFYDESTKIINLDINSSYEYIKNELDILFLTLQKELSSFDYAFTDVYLIIDSRRHTSISHTNKYTSDLCINQVNVENKIQKEKEDIINYLKEMDPLNKILKFDYSKSYTLNELKMYKCKIMEYQEDIKSIFKRHINYKRIIYLNYFLSPLGMFIIPFLIGMTMYTDVSGGIVAILLSSYIYFILLPVALLFTFIIFPKILKSIYFENPSIINDTILKGLPMNYKYIYLDDMAECINIDKKSLIKNSTYTLTGSIISKFINR